MVSVFEPVYPDQTGHYDGEVVWRCDVCGHPKKIWKHVEGCGGRLLPCAVECKCLRIDDGTSVRSKMLRSGFPVRFVDAESSFNPSTQSSYLFGPSRTGKTTAACVLARQAFSAGKTGMFVLMKDVQDKEFDKKAESAAFLKKLSTVGLLVIDDLGKGETGSWSVGVMFDVINDRYNSMRPIIVTSKYSLKQLANELARKSDTSMAEDIVRRIGDMCKTYKFGQQ